MASIIICKNCVKREREKGFSVGIEYKFDNAECNNMACVICKKPSRKTVPLYQVGCSFVGFRFEKKEC